MKELNVNMYVAKRDKHIGIVMNGENLLDYRQSKNEPLFIGSSINPSFVPLWAPIDGRVIKPGS